jgi:hypothetical protein
LRELQAPGLTVSAFHSDAIGDPDGSIRRTHGHVVSQTSAVR